MEDNKEIKEKISSEGVRDTEVFSFRFLIETILDYYYETTPNADPSESWKKGTEYQSKDCPDIPEDVDALVKQAFKTQLKKFVK